MSKRINDFYDPHCTKYQYPEDTSAHYIDFNIKYHHVFDQNYPYIDNSKSFKRKTKLVRFLLRLIVFPMVKIRLGLKIEGKEVLKKNKEVINNGVVSVCNHVHMWDYLGILYTLRNIKPKFLAYADNINGSSGNFVRLVGGIPIPDNIVGEKKMIRTVHSYLREGGWLHIYPEGSMWEYYPYIRPFKRGAVYFALKNDKPVISFVYSYRKPNWIRRTIFRQKACFTIHIGELVYPDLNLEYDVEEEILTRLHKVMCEMANINNNPYSPIYQKSKRIDL